jgi:hypothetical protein
MSRVLLCLFGIALVIAFVAGRSIHNRQTRAARSGAMTSGEAEADSELENRRRVANRRLKELMSRLAAAPPSSGGLEREVLATVADPPEAVDLRHESQSRWLLNNDSTLSSITLQRILGITDAQVQQDRRVRAGFMLGQLSEDEYMDALKKHQREAFFEYQKGLTPENFEKVFHWKPNFDPYDPEGAAHTAVTEVTINPGTPKYSPE